MKEETFQIQDLDNVLETFEEKTGDKGQVEKLLKLLHTFKKKYQKALQDLAEIEKDRDIDARLTEAHEENQALISQQQSLRELVKKHQTTAESLEQKLKLTEETLNYSEEQNRRYKSDLGKLPQKEESASALSQLEAENTELKKVEKELREMLWLAEEGKKQAPVKTTDTKTLLSDTSLTKAIQSLSNKRNLSAVFNTYAIPPPNNAENQEQINQLIDEKEQLSQQLIEMKQSLSQGIKETKEIKHYYQKILNEKAAALQKNTQIQKSLQDLRIVIEQKDREIEISRQQVDLIKSEQSRIERQVEGEKEQKRALENKLRERDDNISSFTEQIKMLQTKVKNAEEAATNKTDSVLEAQQHLAKKMKEYSLLNEKVEGQSREVKRLQDELLSAKGKITELQGTIENTKEQERKLQEQVSNWEEKYFKTYEKLKVAEAQNKELRKVEEKHEQLQHLLGNLGNVIGTPIGLTPSPSSDSPKPKVRTSRSLEKKHRPEPVAVEGSLFEQSPRDTKYKHDLFE